MEDNYERIRRAKSFRNITGIIWILSIVSFGILLYFFKDYDSQALTIFYVVIIGLGIISFLLAIIASFDLLNLHARPNVPKTIVSNKSHLNLSIKSSLLIIFFFGLVLASYLYGHTTGLEEGITIGKKSVSDSLVKHTTEPTLIPTSTPIKVITNTSIPVYRKISFDGPELWEEVNKSRVEHGVGTLRRSDELCSIASYRLNQLLVKGSLDNHAGFNEIWQNESNAWHWITEKYVISEYIIYLTSGNAKDAVDSWDNTMGHQTLLRGGQYVVGCTYAQNGFGVAIVGFQ